MKKERFFRLLGDLDDQVLDKYRQMDVQLSRKALRKKRTLRVLAVAACLVLLIGACVPVGMMIAQLGKGPSDPPPTISLQSLAELKTMREMVDCEDEQVLLDYLHGITGGGAESRQDLIDFLNLVDNTPYARFIDGEITGLTYNKTDECFSVSVEADDGESMYCNYQLGVSDVEKQMAKAARKLGRKNLLSAPLSTQDGRLTLYTETRELSSNGGVIRWQGVLDGIVVYIVYWVADTDAVDTAALLDRLEIVDSIVPQFPKYAWANTKFGVFVETPAYQRYCVKYETYSVPGPGAWMNKEAYQDSFAPPTCLPDDRFMPDIGKMTYEGTVPQTLEAQAVHVYKANINEGYYTVYSDAETGVLVGWEINGRAQSVIAESEQEKLAVAYVFLASSVYDPEAYTSDIMQQDEHIVVRYSRHVGELDTCDAVTVYFASDGRMLSVIIGYLGAMRKLDEVSQELIDTVREYLTQQSQGFVDFEIKIGKLCVTPDGQVALDCSVRFRKTEDAESVEYQYLAYLTEPVNAEADTAPDVTEPVETEPAIIEPVTTEPVVTEPPPAEIPRMIRLGSLAELDLMREMILCEDEQELSQYLSSLNAVGQNVQSKQDLIDFVDLVDSTPFAKTLDGEVISLAMTMSPNSKYHTKNLFVEMKGENGDSISYTYLWSDISVSDRIQSALKTAGTNNLLQAPVQSADGRLTIYTEMREKHILGSKHRIQWWGELDGVFLEITYNVAKPEEIITSELIGSLEMTSIVEQP